jgi:hypothetical protein
MVFVNGTCDAPVEDFLPTVLSFLLVPAKIQEEKVVKLGYL